jgi:hypothetical protein
MYLKALSDPTIGFGNTTTLQLLTHLKTTYSTMGDIELDKNIGIMKKPWHPPTPIKHLFKQIEDGSKFSDDGNYPLSANTGRTHDLQPYQQNRMV